MAKTKKKKKRKLNIPRIVMLALIFVMTVAVIIIAVVLTNAKTKLVDQTAALRWGNGERFAHISAFLSKEQNVDYDTIRQLRDTRSTYRSHHNPRRPGTSRKSAGVFLPPGAAHILLPLPQR